MPPSHMRPQRDRDVLSLLIDHPQQELFVIALHHADAAAMLALPLVSKNVCAALRGDALNEVWAALLPLQVKQCLGQSINCLGQEFAEVSTGWNRVFLNATLLPANLDPRRQYLRSRAATMRLVSIVEGAKSKYKIKTARNGGIDTLEHHSHAPLPLAAWWADVKEVRTSDGHLMAIQLVAMIPLVATHYHPTASGCDRIPSWLLWGYHLHI